jgi:hypothetical protein
LNERKKTSVFFGSRQLLLHLSDFFEPNADGPIFIVVTKWQRTGQLKYSSWALCGRILQHDESKDRVVVGCATHDDKNVPSCMVISKSSTHCQE